MDISLTWGGPPEPGGGMGCCMGWPYWSNEMKKWESVLKIEMIIFLEVDRNIINYLRGHSSMSSIHGRHWWLHLLTLIKRKGFRRKGKNSISTKRDIRERYSLLRDLQEGALEPDLDSLVVLGGLGSLEGLPSAAGPDHEERIHMK